MMLDQLIALAVIAFGIVALVIWLPALDNNDQEATK